MTDQVGPVPPVAKPFQERGEVARLRAVLAPRGVAVVLSGPEGTGKTQLAAHYAHSCRRDEQIDLLVWVTAGSRAAVTTAYALASQALTGVTAPDVRTGAERFLAGLAEGGGRRWLVVLDGLDRSDDLAGLWPPASATGRIVVTTRHPDVAPERDGWVHLPLSGFAAEEAEEFLSTRLSHGRLNGHRPLAGALERRPLALARAAAFLTESDPTEGVDCAAYFGLCTAPEALDQQPTDQGTTNQGTPLSVTRVLAVRAADRRARPGLAGALLHLAAGLDAGGVPLRVLTTPAALTYFTKVTTHRGEGPVDAAEVRSALDLLERLALVEPAPDAIRVREPDPWAGAGDDVAVRAAADAVLEAWGESEIGSGIDPLAFATMALHERAGARLWNGAEGGHDVLLHTLMHLDERGHPAAAEFAGEQWARAATVLGPDHEFALAAQANAALFRARAGDVTGAAADLRAFLAVATPVLGAGHEGVLTGRHNLADLLGRSGAIPEAMAVLGEVAEQETAAGHHVSALGTRAERARLRGLSGDPGRAVKEFGDVLLQCKQVLGPRHPDTLTALAGLAYWRGQTGDVAGALTLFRPALLNRTRVLGAGHPDTLATRAQRADLLGESGEVAEAAAEHRAVAEGWAREWGPDHPETLAARRDQARWVGQAGDPGAALDLLLDVLAAQIRTVGDLDPATLDTRFEIAQLRGWAGDPMAALAGLRELLTDQLRILGPDHAATWNTRAALAAWQAEAGNPASATQTLLAVLDRQGRALGLHHRSTLTTTRHLSRARALAGLPITG